MQKEEQNHRKCSILSVLGVCILNLSFDWYKFGRVGFDINYIIVLLIYKEY